MQILIAFIALLFALTSQIALANPVSDPHWWILPEKLVAGSNSAAYFCSYRYSNFSKPFY
jgi:hypothetical protein